MKLTHGSLFAGVEGFGLGFQQAGYETIWQVEREPYCIAVLKTRFPNVERYYDIKDCGIGRKHKLGAVDVVTAGFPCQDLSVAGKRAGLAGARSGHFWEVIRIVGELRPSWLVLENVPGLFSSNNGRDFAVLLSALGELRLFQSIAWTVLDSQYFGVAQRRRRVFIVCGPRVGSAEQVIFEREGCEGDFAQSSEAWPGIAGSLGGGAYGAGRRTEDDQNYVASEGFSESGPGFWREGVGPLVAAPITASYGKQLDSSDSNSGPPNAIISVRLAQTSSNGWGISEDGRTHTLDSTGGDAVCAPAHPDRMRDAPRLSEGLDDTRFSLLPEGIDSPRYRAIGNAVTVSVAKYLAERIKAVAEE